MATTLSPASSVTVHRYLLPNRKVNYTRIRCSGGGGNIILKAAWYGSELLGIGASFFRSPKDVVEGSMEVVLQLKMIANLLIQHTNFGYLIEKSSMKLMKWEDFELHHGVPMETYSFSYCKYYLSKESGKVCRHVEHWNVPKMALFKQLLKHILIN
ncbi:hypothetical protein L1987_25574 [Smallanthus sonchifolius]|uniref:Uncharacterized protein n=1 Tax=Smallanthus sonchifolius TaxID=185202 RepID=A0ACB9I806_9ASTR|nr:hypothetical protein L1987_25574 [Smallanthus sonchifolius]